MDTLGTRKTLSLEELVTQHIADVLAAHGGNVSAAARALGMDRRTLQRRLRRRVSSARTERNAAP